MTKAFGLDHMPPPPDLTDRIPERLRRKMEKASASGAKASAAIAAAKAKPVAALEANEPHGRVRRVRSVHQDHTPDHVVVLDPSSVEPAVEVIRCRLRQVQKLGGGAYLFIDHELRAFVLTDLQSITALWVRDHLDWLVGFYASKRAKGVGRGNSPYLAATQGGLVEDVQQHLHDLAEAA